MTTALDPTPSRPADDDGAPHALARHIETAFIAYLEQSRRTASPHPDRVFASQWRECARQMWYDCTSPQYAAPFPPEVLAKFRYGSDRETAMIIDLTQTGRQATPPFRVLRQQQDCTLRDRRGRPALRGKIDGFIEYAETSLPFEIKNWSAYLTDRIETFADVLTNPYTKAGAYQLLVYMIAFGREWGMLLLDRSGIPKFIPVALTDDHLDAVETFLARAESVLDHVEAGTQPDYIEDAATCRRCPYYGTVCNPPLLAAAPNILLDPDLERALERRETLKAAGKEYDALDKDIKGRLRGVEHAMIGAFEISGAWAKSSRVVLPPDLKRQYTVTDPRGRFTLDIERLPTTGGATDGNDQQPTTQH